MTKLIIDIRGFAEVRSKNGIYIMRIRRVDAGSPAYITLRSIVQSVISGFKAYLKLALLCP